MKKKPSNTLKPPELESNTILLISKELSLPSGSLPEDSVQNLKILSLSHPREKRKALFVHNPNNSTILEILKFSQPHRSWFIGNTIESDGKLYLSTPVDPLFLVLPYIYESKMSSTLDQLIHDDQFTDSTQLESLVTDEQLSLIADKKDCRGLIVWKFNEEKTLNWLSEKVNKVAKVLEQKKMHVGVTTAVSNNYVKSINQKESEENYLRYSHGIVSDYLVTPLAEKLLQYLNLPPLETLSKKRKNTDLDSDDIRKLKKECAEKDIVSSKYFDEENKTEKATRKNPKQAALAKAATGTKSISSFFKKK